MPQVKLKRLKIQKYRNVKPGTELRFDNGINLILGQNASGKTTLLALISAVCRADFRELDDEDLELEADLSCEGELISLSAIHRRATPATRTRGWACRFSFASSEPLELDEVPSGWGHDELVFLSAQYPPLITANQAFRFDESLDAFLATTGRRGAVKSPASPVPSTIEVEFYNDRSYYPLRLDYVPDGSSIGAVSSSDDALCRQIAAGLDAIGVVMKPEIREQSKRDDHDFFLVEGFTFDITRRDGTTIHHDRLSYGQKRLLAFYYYLACNPSIVIADELVNGLHHRWIAAAMKALGDRQAFLTSQNPLLFDYVDFDSVEQVQARFITCRLEQLDGREQMVWENMHRDDAERFFAAYQAEIEHVGEILMNRGLW